MDYSKALEAAEAAALNAGQMIREEYYRSNGPRGHGGHADVDEEAEATIRHILLERFPDFCFVGEETGRVDRPTADYTWYVDPNDGTSAFLEGYRGSAVAIGLVRKDDGLPVLGTVYCPLLPDDDGDLFTWAEGLPLRRNGRIVDRAPFPQKAHSATIVIVNHRGNDDSATTAQITAPARFISMPSIAYRLALVAAGDADLAVSTSSPTHWDVAGGHALLIGAGADLFDAQGEAVRYNAPFRSDIFFGGVRSLAHELSQRNWTGYGGRYTPDPLTLSYVSAHRSPGSISSDVVARAHGALLGQVAGDALGQQVEFSSSSRIHSLYPEGLREIHDGGYWNTIAGQPTDDSELALLLARTIIRDGEFRAEAVRQAYRDWYDSHPFDVGSTTSAGIRGQPNYSSQANGGLMRISPVGVWGWNRSEEQVAATARADAALTHPNDICGDASAIFATAVARAIRTGEPGETILEFVTDWAKNADVNESVISALNAAAQQPPHRVDGHDMGWVLIALQNAFYEAAHAATLEQGVVRTVMRGGDTDTNCAIAGALLGAIHGRDSVPLQWRRAVLSCRALPDTTQPRPKLFWPTDVLDLARSLAECGN